MLTQLLDLYISIQQSKPLQMKHLLLISLVALTAMFSCAPEKTYQTLPIGSSIPEADVKMKSVNGNDYSIKDMMSKNGVMVMFSCNTCPIVEKYKGRTLEAIKEAKENGFGVIIVNSNEDYRNGEDSFTAMQEYAKEQNYDVPYVVDVNSTVADAFGASRTPETFLFNAKGELIYHGSLDDNQDAAQVKRKHLSAAIGEVLSGKIVSVNNTNAVGCSIKRKG